MSCVDGMSGQCWSQHLLIANRYTASLLFYKSLLGIRSVKAASENELHLEYDVPTGTGQATSVTLVLLFDNLTKKLANAEVSFLMML